jgi:transcriptional regulator with XRE-family HTH domain
MVYGNLKTTYIGHPYEYAKAMGELIRKARSEAGLSQASLANRANLRQAFISDLENGKAEASARDLIYLSQALEKPILYFFPDWTIQKAFTEHLPPELEILLINARKLPKNDIHKLIIQVKALAAEEEKSEETE